MPSLRVLLAAFALFTATALAADEPDWQPVLTDLLRSEKTGFGGLCGVVVDHDTGCIWVNLSDRGLFCSKTGAKDFKRVADAQPKGRTETPGCLMLDPTGKSKKMVTALVYGSPISVSPDHGKTWTYLDRKSGHVDWCAVDWTDPDLKFVLALKHEAGGLLLASRDGGKSFTEVGKGYGPGWVFDADTAVVAEAKTKDRPKPGLVRTTDGGKTWKPAGAYVPVGSNSAQALPRWRDGTLYWLVQGALIRTADRGETWKKVSELKDARYGPVFGKDGKHLFVLIGTGIVESTDGGASWSRPIALPKGLKGAGGLTWVEYDPKGKFLYVMKMTSDLYRLARD
jgi:hypothetical protein